MCVTCGCSDDAEVTIVNQDNHHHHTLPDGTVITHSHAMKKKGGTGNEEQGNGELRVLDAVTEESQIHAKIHSTTISLEQEILRKNNLIAAQNRGWFQGRNILALNLMSSPGAGKTTLLTRTINDLKDKLSISVIEGDQETANDAQKIKQTGCKVVQINTGTGCHLDAGMIAKGVQQLNPPLDSVVMIENVGNLVCPALFDLGEQAKVVILSVTEGEDKPIKYPHMFRASQIMVITKIDLLPYVQFDVQRCIKYALEINPQMVIFQVSALTGAGLNDWYDWLSNTESLKQLNLSLPLA